MIVPETSSATALRPALIDEYLARSLPARAPFPRRVRTTQEGELWLKPDGRALRFEAIEEFAVDEVAFDWTAKVRVAPLVWIRVRDRYAAGKGSLDVQLAGLPLSRAGGRDIAVGEAMRYLAELAWVPQAMGASPELEWHEIEESIVEVSTSVGDSRATVGLRFDPAGDLIAAFADRPRPEGKESPLRHWVGLYHDFAEVGGIRIPTRAQVHWELPDGPFTYWRGTVTSLETS